MYKFIHQPAVIGVAFTWCSRLAYLLQRTAKLHKMVTVCTDEIWEIRVRRDPRQTLGLELLPVVGPEHDLCAFQVQAVFEGGQLHNGIYWSCLTQICKTYPMPPRDCAVVAGDVLIRVNGADFSWTFMMDLLREEVNLHLVFHRRYLHQFGLDGSGWTVAIQPAWAIAPKGDGEAKAQRLCGRGSFNLTTAADELPLLPNGPESIWHSRGPGVAEARWYPFKERDRRHGASRFRPRAGDVTISEKTGNTVEPLWLFHGSLLGVEHERAIFS